MGIGLRSQLMTSSKGLAVVDQTYDSYRPDAGDIPARDKGSILATDEGECTTFGIEGCQGRGKMYVSPKEKVYKNMIIGQHQRPGDLKMNSCKAKAVNNI